MQPPRAGPGGGVPGPQAACGFLAHDRFAVRGSGWPRAAPWLGRWQQGWPVAATREGGEPPRAAAVPGAAQVAGTPCRCGMGVQLLGAFRGDGLGNHRMHDILLAGGPPCSGAVIDIVLEGYDSPAPPNSSVRSLGMPPRQADGPRGVGVATAAWVACRHDAGADCWGCSGSPPRRLSATRRAARAAGA
jgi:hypothetical protein